MVPTIRMAAIRAALDTMYFTGAHLVSQSLFGGLGAILMFHRVRPPRPAKFQPNESLEITPEFLEEVIAYLQRRDIPIVSLDEACRRIETGRPGGRFVALTFDDGYRDNLEHAFPVLRRHDVPFTVFVASGFADGEGPLWWLALEEVIADNGVVTLTIGGQDLTFECPDAPSKSRAYSAFARIVSGAAGAARDAISEMSSRYGIDFAKQCASECLSWEELSVLGNDPLATIGAHTISHPILSPLTASDAEREVRGSVRRIAEMLNVEPVHFAYPHGGPNEAAQREFDIAERLGFKSAVTTRPGVLFPEHSERMTALPRISVNGCFQQVRYLDALLSGAPTTLRNGFRRADAT